MKTFIAIAFGVLCGLLGAGVIFLASRPPRGDIITLLPPPTPAPLVVHVTGAVVNPGVYTLPVDSRGRDAVEAAGGFTAEANPSGINLAAPLKDGQLIAVMAKASTLQPTTPRPTSTPRPTQTMKPTGQSQGTSSATTVTPKTTEFPTATSVVPGLININTATLEELDTLPGIGPSTAQKIIDYRNTNGPFTKIEDIMNVTGIGQIKFEAIKDLITVGP